MEHGPQSSLLNPNVGLWAEDGRIDTILRHPSCKELGHSWKPEVFLCNHHHVIRIRIFPAYLSVFKPKTDIVKSSKLTIPHLSYLIQHKVLLFLLRKYIQNGPLPYLQYTPWSGGPSLSSLYFYSCSSQPVPHSPATVIQCRKSGRSFSVH